MTEFDTIDIHTTRDQYSEIVEWCYNTFNRMYGSNDNGRYDVYELAYGRILVRLTPYTLEAATLMTLRWT
jgi:hypothetical protein